MDGLNKLVSIFTGGGNASTGEQPLWQRLLLGGMLGTGEVGNILEERKRAEYQNQLLSLIKDPAKLTQMILKAERPLDNSLVQAVNNRVQADLASRGLSQAPGIFGASEAQALAPFQQQNYSEAMNQVLASLGLPGGTFRQPENLSPLLTQFLRSFGTKAPTGGGGTDTGGLTLPQPVDVGTPSGGGPWFGDTVPSDTGGVWA